MPQEAKPGRYGTQPLKEILREERITHAAAAEAIGTSTHLITQLSNGQTSASLQTAAKLARLVGRPIEELFSPSMLGVEPAKEKRKKRPI
jgi:DNA-binding XRE family transcriptional regulator